MPLQPDARVDKVARGAAHVPDRDRHGLGAGGGGGGVAGRKHGQKALIRADHHHALQLLQPVHLGEDGVDDALRHVRLAQPAAASGNEAVELVDEDDGDDDEDEDE